MSLKPQNKKYLYLPDFKKCQVFTPPQIADKMIDLVESVAGFPDLVFLECSCGDGAILVRLVERYIKRLLGSLTLSSLVSRLKKQFCGCEIDPEKITQCRINLDSVTQKYNIPKVDWNLTQCDFLTKEFGSKFDIIIGNPPYVSYLNLSPEAKGMLRQNYRSCATGKFDYCFPFIEKSVSLLTDNGRLVFLTPESIYKTKSASTLRRQILPYLDSIDVSLGGKSFKNAQITPSILHLSKNGSTHFSYVDKKGGQVRLSKDSLLASDKWSFLCTDRVSPKRRFGDCFCVSSSVATLANDIFVLRNGSLSGEFYICENGERIERGLLRQAFSPNLQRKGIDAFIIYPYDEAGRPLSELYIQHRFPRGYAYLISRKKMLLDRDYDHGANWFEYGRKQSIGLTALEKYCLSIFVTGKPSIWKCSSGSVAFSGIIISQKTRDNSLALVPRILSSDAFIKYAMAVGVPCSTGSWRITASDLKEYCFDGID